MLFPKTAIAYDLKRMFSFLPFIFWLATPGPQGLEALLSAHGWQVPTRRLELDVAAERLAEALSVHSENDEKAQLNSNVTVRKVLAQTRVSDAQVVPFTVHFDSEAELEAAWPKLVGQLDRHLPPTDYGFAQIPGEVQTVSVLMVHRGFTLDQSLQDQLSSSKSESGARHMLFSGELHRGYFRPRLLIALPNDGPVVERGLEMHGRRVEASLKFDDKPGCYGIELLAESSNGPIVLLNDVLTIGNDKPSDSLINSFHLPAGTSEEQLFSLINQYRSRHNLPILKQSPRLRAAAASHAQELANQRTLRHVSPNTGALAMRLSGLKAAGLAENLAWAPDSKGALSAFLESPGHKRNLLLPQLSHMGIGVSGSYYVVAFAILESSEN